MNRRARFLCFTTDEKLKVALETFKQRFQQDPLGTLTNDLLRVGPIPGDEHLLTEAEQTELIRLEKGVCACLS